MLWLIGISLFWCIGMIMAIALCRAAGNDTSDIDMSNDGAAAKAMSSAICDLHQHQQEHVLRN